MEKCIRAEEPGSALTYAMREEIAAKDAPTEIELRFVGAISIAMVCGVGGTQKNPSYTHEHVQAPELYPGYPG